MRQRSKKKKTGLNVVQMGLLGLEGASPKWQFHVCNAHINKNLLHVTTRHNQNRPEEGSKNLHVVTNIFGINYSPTNRD